MRDPNRIPVVLTALQKEWEKSPHLRLGQLLLNMARNEQGATDKHVLWTMEDTELLRRLDKSEE
jgi:uncharacterized protein YihD (DUF1040 family)